MYLNKYFLYSLFVMITYCFSLLNAAELQKLKISDNKRYIVKQDGSVFFYLGDTAWELFHRTTREQALNYLKLRANQKFTVIQAVILAEKNILSEPNLYGHFPLIDKDPTKPAETPGNNPEIKTEYDYWDHVDYIIEEANKLGLYIALLPSWGRYVAKVKTNDQPIFTIQSAQIFGEYIGKRYRDKKIIWVLGGDRDATGVEDIWRSMAKGIAIGVTGTENYKDVMMTFHPKGAGTSSQWFHNDEWLDFNMLQTGHNTAEVCRTWEWVYNDYIKTPTKPVVEGEPLYEDHPINFRVTKEYGFSTDAHVRQRAYWDIFAGACGFAFGNHAIWQMYAPGIKVTNGALYYWEEALDRPAAKQLKYLRALMESRPMLQRIPDQSLVVDTLTGRDHIQATRGNDYAFIYTGTGRSFKVNLGKISGKDIKAYWMNPRNGAVTEIGTFENSGIREFVSPFDGFGSDWVLILDDATKSYSTNFREN